MNSLAGLVFLFSAIFLTINAKKVCVMDQQTIMADVEQCMMHDLGLAMAISQHMSNPSSMETPDFLCKHSHDLVDLADCLVKKMADCVPNQSKLLLSMFPNKERMQEAFKFICDHKAVLNNKCMNSHMDSFMQCYMGKIQMLTSTNLAISKDPQKILCSVLRSEEKCIEENKGTCSSDFIAFVFKVLEMFFPVKNCPKVPASLLLRGEPLIFKPYNKGRGYAIKP